MTARETPARPATWTITTTTNAFTASGYLPAWADKDASRADVPPDQLAFTLADITHWARIEGQPLTLCGPETDGRPQQVEVFAGAIDCIPYADDPALRVPVASIEIGPDHYVNDLTPDGLAELAARLRAQADYLDHEIRPRLIAYRQDWAEQHPT